MITAKLDNKLVLELRNKTGAGFLDCQKALQETSGDVAQAVELLRKKGIATASSKLGRATKEGAVTSYIHHGSRLGVLLEVNCETDFVARTQDFQDLAKELCMQIAASNPHWVSKEEVPKEVLDKEREIYVSQAQASGKPPQAVEKMVEGKVSKFLSEVCLLEQVSIRDTSGKTKVKDLVAQTSTKTGENITVRRFSRFQIGE